MQDAVRDMHGKSILGKEIRTEISKRSRNGGGGGGGGGYDRPRGNVRSKGEYRVNITGLPRGVDWRDLKDFLRPTAPPAYANIDNNSGDAVADFETLRDAETIIEKLDKTTFKGDEIRIKLDPDFRGGGGGGGGGYGGYDRGGRDGRDYDRGGRDYDRRDDRSYGRDRDRGRDYDDRDRCSNPPFID